MFLLGSCFSASMHEVSKVSPFQQEHSFHAALETSLVQK